MPNTEQNLPKAATIARKIVQWEKRLNDEKDPLMRGSIRKTIDILKARMDKEMGL